MTEKVINTSRRPKIPQPDQDVIDYFDMDYVGKRFYKIRGEHKLEYFPQTYFKAVGGTFVVTKLKICK